MKSAPMQLALNLRLPAHATFETFVAGPNAGVVRAVHALAGRTPERQIYLWGAGGVGKSHQLQALCRAQGEGSRPSVYLPLGEIRSLSPGILEGVEELSVVCIDDVHLAAGDPEWELALFGLTNRCRDTGCVLVLAARGSPTQLGIALPDLASRLAWGPVYRLRPLEDGDRIRALQLHGAQRGLDIPDEVGRYLLTRSSRELRALLGVLDTLDEVSLATRRRITVPLVRSVLAGGMPST